MGIDKFYAEGDVTERVMLQTRHAQQLLIARALDILRERPLSDAKICIKAKTNPAEALL